MFGTSGGFGSFGAKSPTVGFGSTTTQPANAFGAGGFGATTPAAQPAFGGFGATAAPAFGSTTAPAFGATSTAARAFGATAAPAFGASAAPAFGATTPAPAFGATAAPAFGAGTTSGFGASSTTLGFGTTPAASATPAFGGFGSTGGFGQAAQAKPATTFGGFGATPAFGTAGSSFQMQSAGQQQQQQFGMQAAPSTTGKIAKSIEKLQQAYAPYKDASGRFSADPSAGQYNEECVFKTYMYDRRSGASHFADPSLSGTLLEQAEINNPDPSRYYPVRILGIDALKARFDQQQTESLRTKEHLQSVREVIDTVELSNTQIDTRVAALQMRQAHLYQRLLALLRKVEVLRCRGSAFEKSEEKYRSYLNQILAAMKAPYLQIQELANNVAQQDFPQDVYSEAVSYDAAELEALYDALRRQREGLEFVTDILTKDVRDMKIVKAAMQESGGAMS